MKWLAAAYPAPTSTTVMDMLHLPTDDSFLAKHLVLFMEQVLLQVSEPQGVMIDSTHVRVYTGSN